MFLNRGRGYFCLYFIGLKLVKGLDLVKKKVEMCFVIFSDIGLDNFGGV